MSWFNYYGLAIVAIILIPNFVYAIKHKESFKNYYSNKFIEVLEQVGRYGCIALMIFNIPYTYFNFWFGSSLIIYLTVNGVLLIAYLVSWIVLWNSNGKVKALLLSVLPSAIFIFSGVILASIPLIVFSVIFTVNHLVLSCKNSVIDK